MLAPPAHAMGAVEASRHGAISQHSLMSVTCYVIYNNVAVMFYKKIACRLTTACRKACQGTLCRNAMGKLESAVGAFGNDSPCR